MGEVVSNKGKDKLVDHERSFVYVFDKVSKSDDSTEFWRCERKRDCKGRVWARDRVIVSRRNEHTHDGCAATIEAHRAVTTMKRRAKDAQEVHR